MRRKVRGKARGCGGTEEGTAQQELHRDDSDGHSRRGPAPTGRGLRSPALLEAPLGSSSPKVSPRSKGGVSTPGASSDFNPAASSGAARGPWWAQRADVPCRRAQSAPCTRVPSSTRSCSLLGFVAPFQDLQQLRILPGEVFPEEFLWRN